MRHFTVLFALLFVGLLLSGCQELYPQPSVATGVLPLAPPTETLSPQPLTPTVTETAIPTVTPDPAQWVWTFNPADRTVLQINPQSNAVTGSVKLKGRPVAVAVGMNAVWVITQGKKSSSLYRIDPATLTIEAGVPIPQGMALSLAAGEGAIWVGVAALESGPLPPGMEASRPGGILRVDPATNQITDYLARPMAARQILIYERTLWVLEWLEFYTLLGRIDPASLQIQTIPAALNGMQFVHQFSRIAINPAGVWAAPLNPASRFIYQVDPISGGIVKAIQVGSGVDDQPVDLLATDLAVWVALRSGQVVLLDPYQQKVVTRLQAHPGLAELFLAAGALWVTNPAEGEIYRIDPKSQQFVDAFSTGSKLEPTTTPTPITRPGEGECQAAYDTRLRVGGRAVVQSDPPLPNRVRDSPGLKGGIIGEIPPGRVILILEGPICANNWWWWKVQAADGLIGWTAEGDREHYWLAPAD